MGNSKALRIITSGAFVDSELEAEFGRVPPSFLPVATGLLVHRQLELWATPDVDLALSIPSDFAVDPSTDRRLKAHDCSIILTDATLSLGKSLANILASIAPSGPMELIHGDTLIKPPANDHADVMTVAELGDGYRWAAAEITDGMIRKLADNRGSSAISDAPTILTGFFRFSEPDELLRALVRNNNDFITALSDYCSSHDVHAVESVDWLDFGHVQTYFRSRHVLAATRHFNSLRIANGIVQKSSNDTFKMAAEAAWLRSLPSELQIYAARLIEDPTTPRAGTYSTEYSYLPTLAEIAQSRLGRAGWLRIMESVSSFLETEAISLCTMPINTNLHTLAIEKTRSRISSHPEFFPFNSDSIKINGKIVPKIDTIIDVIESHIQRETDPVPSIMHGDFCFSNILYNSRTQRIIVIDPRGYITSEKASIYGDIRYDIAKFAHSIVGRYDDIIAGNYVFNQSGSELELHFENDDMSAWREDRFLSSSFAGIPGNRPDIIGTMITLFISMIPLHSDRPDRQIVFFANALRLYQRFFG